MQALYMFVKLFTILCAAVKDIILFCGGLVRAANI